MELTDQQLAHILAALRATQNQELGAMTHFEDAGPPLTSEEVDQLCERLSTDPDGKTGYTVVGIFPDSCWGNGLYDASFVHHVSADTPLDAAKAGKLQAAKGRLVDDEDEDEEEMAEEVTEFAEGIVILAAMKGLVPDLYDPDLECRSS